MTDPKYPEGQLGFDDEGAIGVAIGIKDGNVIIQFPTPVVWLGLPANQAAEMGRTLIKKARQAIESSKH